MFTKATLGTRFKLVVGVLPACDEKTRQVIEYALIVFALGYSVYLYQIHAWDITQWDFLLLTGVACFYIGLKEVGFLKERFEYMLKRLVERGVIELIDGHSFDCIKNEFEDTAHTWMRVTGLICGIAMLVAFVNSLTINFKFDRLLLTILEVVGAYIAGNYFGRMIWYGRLGKWLSKKHKKYNIDPSHVDGLCGLAPAGDYYFYQASIASIPAIFLAVWWLLIPIWPIDYSHWHDAYFGLLIIAVLVEILAFMIPLFSIHGLMNRQKKALISEADALSVKITELKSSIANNKDIERAKVLKDQLDETNARYWAIENMKTWPVDVKTKKQFGINNIILFLPLAYNSFNQTFKFEDLLKTLTKVQF